MERTYNAKRKLTLSERILTNMYRVWSECIMIICQTAAAYHLQARAVSNIVFVWLFFFFFRVDECIHINACIYKLRTKVWNIDINFVALKNNKQTRAKNKTNLCLFKFEVSGYKTPQTDWVSCPYQIHKSVQTGRDPWKKWQKRDQ